jgi:hypothetical protein
MVKPAAKMGRLDRLAIGLSGLCAVHCVATAVLLSLMATAGGLLGNPLIHEVGLALAMLLGAAALGSGAMRHRHLVPLAIGAGGIAVMAWAMTLHETGWEPLFTIVGVAVLALGHRLNCIAAAQPKGLI